MNPRMSVEDRLARLDPAQRAALAARLSTARTGAAPLRRQPGPRDRFPLGMDQERLWILDRMFPGTTTYTLGFGLRFLGDFDIDTFRHAAQAVVARHELLRCGIEADGDTPYLKLHEQRGPDIVVVDLPGPPEETETRRAAFIESQVQRVFDLRTDPVLRIGIGCLGDGDFQVVQTMPHSFTDQWSYVRLNRELIEHYRALRTGDTPNVPDLPVQFGDFAAWQRDYFATSQSDRHRTFWRDYLAGAPTLPLPYDHSPDIDDHKGAQYGFVLNERSAAAFIEAAAAARTTAATATLAAYVALLYEESGEQDIVVGIPSVTRSQQAVTNIVGFLLTNIPVRVRVPHHPTPRALLAAVNAASAASVEHREVPFGEIVRAALPGRPAQRYPILQTMLVHLNLEESVFFEVPGAQVYANAVPEGISSMDMTVAWWQMGDTMYGRIEYRTALFEPATIERLARRLVELVDIFATDPDVELRPRHRPAAFVANSDPGALARRRAGEAWTAVLGGPADDDQRLTGPDAPLHAVLLSQRLTEAGYPVSPRDVLPPATFGSLAGALTSVPVQALRGPLTPQQQDVLDADPRAMSHVVVDWQAPVDTERLAEAARAVVAAHPALSTVLHRRGVLPGDAWRWATASGDVDAVLSTHRAALDLGSGTTFLVTHLPGASSRTVLSASDLVVDEYSWRIVLADLALAYDGEALVPEPVNALRYAAAVRRIDAAAQSPYWQAVMTDAAAARDVGTGKPVRLVHPLPAGLRPAPAEIIAATGRALDAPVVTIRTDGRTPPPGEPSWDPARAVGRYAVAFPLTIAPALQDDLPDVIAATAAALARVPDGGLGYGLLRHGPDPALRRAFAERPAVCVDLTTPDRHVLTTGDPAGRFDIEVSIRDATMVLTCRQSAPIVADLEAALARAVAELTAAGKARTAAGPAEIGVSEEYMDRLFARVSRSHKEKM